MTIAPIRDLGSIGVVTDVDAFDLPPKAFTMATNARFADNKVQRGPVFRTVGALTKEPRSMVSFVDTNNTKNTILCNLDGTVQSFVPNATYGSPTLTDLSAAGWTPSNAELQYTSVMLNDVVYLNRPDRVPWYRLRNGTTFATLPNWNSNWRCQSLRAFGGTVIALGPTKSGVYYPTTVTWSDLSTFQAYPGTWTPTVGNSAGEVPLSDMADVIVDGFPIRDRFLIYGSSEVWAMTQTLDNNVYAFKRVFRNGGVINQNCIVEIDGIHYVFGPFDIYKTDGFTRTSLCDNRVRKFIFNSIQRTENYRFFAVHNPRLSEIEFYYVSNDGYLQFPYIPSGMTGCNRSATYNYLTDTWVFRDQPYIVYAGTGAISAGQDYSLSTTYGAIGGAYSSFGDSSQKTFIVAGTTVAASSLSASVYTFDQPDAIGTNAPLSTTANAPMYLEKTWMDMDELGAELRGYKVGASRYPRGRCGILGCSATFSLAGAA